MRVDIWSWRAVPLQTKCCGHDIGSATGFFWHHSGETFLVTNWHVLAGRSPHDMQPLNPDGALPDEVIYPRFIVGEPFYEVIYESISLAADDRGVPWFQHPVYGASVDVAAVGVPAVVDVQTSRGIRTSYGPCCQSDGARRYPE